MKNTKPRACKHDDPIGFSEIHKGKVYCGVCEKYFGLEEWSPDKPKITSKESEYLRSHIRIIETNLQECEAQNKKMREALGKIKDAPCGNCGRGERETWQIAEDAIIAPSSHE